VQGIPAAGCSAEIDALEVAGPLVEAQRGFLSAATLLWARSSGIFAQCIDFGEVFDFQLGYEVAAPQSVDDLALLLGRP
jgi:hypothetical protein